MRKLAALLIPLVIFLFSCESKPKEEATPKSEFNGVLLEEPAYDFELTTVGGKRVKLSDFKGKLVFIFFGYTHCPDVCPAALQNLAKMMELLDPKEREQVQVIMISVDPERDKPNVVDEYAKYFYPTFVGLTGSLDEIKEVAKRYKAFFKKAEGESASGYLVDHTAYVYLIDKAGNLKLLYSSSKQKPQLMAEDVKKLLEE